MIQVLVENIKDLGRAHEFAATVDEPYIWSELAAAQLSVGELSKAIDSYIKAGDPNNYIEVSKKCSATGSWEDLLRYLLMAREKLREPYVETELCFALGMFLVH